MWVAGSPAVLSIEPTNICNLKCPQCPTGAGTLERPQGKMGMELYREIINAAAEHVIHIEFFFQGEPFLNNNFIDMLRYAKGKNIYTVTSTNGHYLTENNVEDLLDSGLDAIIIGLDGTTPEVYNQYRKNGDYDTVIRGIKTLVEMRQKKEKKHPRIYIQFIVMKQNESQVAEARNLKKELNVDKVMIKTAQVYQDMSPEYFLPENKDYSRYKVANGEITLNVEIPDRCRRVWTHGVFTWDGRLASCCFDKDAKHAFGSWDGKPLRELWLSEQGMKFRERILQDRKSIQMCLNCTEGIRIYR